MSEAYSIKLEPQNEGEAPYLQFWKNTVHTARIAKRCNLCGGEIQSGERYRKHVAKVDDEFSAKVYHESFCM